MRKVPIAVIFMILMAAGRSHTAATSPPPLLSLRLMSQPRGAPPDSYRAVPRVWSQHDFEDTLVVEAAVSAGSLDQGGSVLGAVEYRVARIRRASPTGEVTPAVWLPATQVLRGSFARGTSDSQLLRLGCISPASTLRALREADPDLEFVAVRVRVFLVAPGVGAFSAREQAQRTVGLAMGD
jgi:hypothetical protein